MTAEWVGKNLPIMDEGEGGRSEYLTADRYILVVQIDRSEEIDHMKQRPRFE